MIDSMKEVMSLAGITLRQLSVEAGISYEWAHVLMRRESLSEDHKTMFLKSLDALLEKRKLELAEAEKKRQELI